VAPGSGVGRLEVAAWIHSQRTDERRSSDACFHGWVISPTSVAQETARRLRRSSIRVGDDVRDLRSDAGVSLRELGAATGLDPSHIARIEKGQVQPSVQTLTLISVALGADLSIRFYAGSGPRIRDRFQAPMIEALIRTLQSRWTQRLEVRIPGPTRGIVDLVLTDRAEPVTVIGEAQSEFFVLSSSNCGGSPRRPPRSRGRYRSCSSSGPRSRPARSLGATPRRSRRLTRLALPMWWRRSRVLTRGRAMGSSGCDSSVASQNYYATRHAACRSAADAQRPYA
jgi:transcriptional regulator with XRE-family HTH domain